jgi:hypothetical protein
MGKPKYDTTVARIAGNIFSGLTDRAVTMSDENQRKAVVWSVRQARAIVAEIQRTEPQDG